jgi:hypothetical protein
MDSTPPNMVSFPNVLFIDNMLIYKLCSSLAILRNCSYKFSPETNLGLKRGFNMPPEGKSQAKAGQVTQSALFDEIRTVRKKIDDLESRINEESKGSLAWAKKWEVWLAIIAAVFALPRGGLDLYHFFWNRPDSRLTAGSSLIMTYQPAESKLAFTFDFTAINVGTEDDLFQVRGQFTGQANSQNDSWPISPSDFGCSSQGVKLLIPFAARTGIPISIECTISINFDPAKSDFSLRPGINRLTVDFSGTHNRTRSLDFCFYLTKSTMDEVFGSGHQEQRRFVYPNCEQNP